MQTAHLAHLAPFTANDGENLALYEWQADDAVGGELAPCMTAPRGVVLIVHGLGEHAGRYQHVASQLMAWGFMVRAYDQRGHGESGGPRGVIPHDTALLDDLAEVVDFSRSRCHDLLAAFGADGVPVRVPPLILLGHSLGGLVASCFVALGTRPVDALVLSSPALDAGLGAVKKMALALALRVAPQVAVSNGLNPRFLSHNAQVVADYCADPLVHSRISPMLGQFIAERGPATIEAAAHWRLPTLLMYAGADHLVDPQGSARFAAAASGPGVPPGTVTSCCFGAMYHEIFNEDDAADVFNTLKTWLDARFP